MTLAGIARDSAARTARSAAHRPAAAGRVGPNAITRTAEALTELAAPATAARVFRAAGLSGYLAEPPDAMVDEREVAALCRCLHDELSAADYEAVGQEAGRRTGDYLLANRIPGPVQTILKPLPAALAAPILISAIAKHAWTFAGSGTFEHRGFLGGVAVTIAGCPLCRDIRAETPACGYYAATFERLFRVLVSPTARAVETACAATGADACTFSLAWRRLR